MSHSHGKRPARELSIANQHGGSLREASRFAGQAPCADSIPSAALIVVVLLWSVPTSIAEIPTNAQVIAAMPPGTESVMVQRVSVFKADTSIFRDEYSRPGPTHYTSKNIKTVVSNATQSALPVIFAWGGSDFQMPPDTGMTGNYNERAIYITEKSVASLREQLDSQRDVEGVKAHFDVAGVRVFEGTIDDESNGGRTHNSAGEVWYVAIPNEHTVVSAESRSDIEYMLHALGRNLSRVPAWWADVADGHSIESPLVILRTFPPTVDVAEGRPRNCLAPPGGTTHFALTLPQVNAATMKVSILASDADQSINWFKSTNLADSEYEWAVKRVDGGITATLVPTRVGAKPKYMTLRWVLLFGPFVMI